MSTENKSMIMFMITGWNAERSNKLAQFIKSKGFTDEDIRILSERKSRAGVLNWWWMRTPTKYKYICLLDDDIVFGNENFIENLTQVMDSDENIGACVVPAIQINDSNKNQIIKPSLAQNTPLPFCVKEIHYLTTFNIIMFRRDMYEKGIIFEEGIFGSQIIDVDFGMELNYRGYKVVEDHRNALGHSQTNYVEKNLAYHAIVSRCRQVLRAKWLDRNNWPGSLDLYNQHHPENLIPSVEEITHWPEPKMVEYIAKWDKFGLKQCYLLPRYPLDSPVCKHYLDIVNRTPDEYKFGLTVNGKPGFMP